MHKPDKKQRRKPKQARAIQKYNEILDASARVLNQIGYGRTTMSEIHLESGHPYATIYQYFSNKEDIYLAWLERFMDNSIFELAGKVNRASELNQGERIELSVRYSLEQIVLHRQTLSLLVNGMGLVSSRLVEQVEEKSRGWIKRAFGPNIERPENAALMEKMLTATRAGNGYWLMLMLNTRRDIDIDQETENVAALINALLSVR